MSLGKDLALLSLEPDDAARASNARRGVILSSDINFGVSHPAGDAASGKFLIMPQPSYGARTPFTVRVPKTHAAVYTREAKRLGMTYSDYIAAKLAELHGLDAPESVQARYAQEVLPETA